MTLVDAQPSFIAWTTAILTFKTILTYASLSLVLAV